MVDKTLDGQVQNTNDNPELDPVDSNKNKESGYIEMLRMWFSNPLLTLLKVYLSESENRKHISTALKDFKDAHPKVFVGIFLIDFTFNLLSMFIVLLVIIRGLGIHSFVKELFDMFNLICASQ